MFLLNIAEDYQLIISCSIGVSRNTHTYTHESEPFLEGENYTWHDMDWCKYSNYFHSACSLTVGLKRVLNKLVFHILIGAWLKVTWRRSEIDTNLINMVTKYFKCISPQRKCWGTFYCIIITLYKVLRKNKLSLFFRSIFDLQSLYFNVSVTACISAIQLPFRLLNFRWIKGELSELCW